MRQTGISERAVCEALGVDRKDSLRTPTWNSEPLEEIYPWGTIQKPTPEANRNTAEGLSIAERIAIRAATWQYLEVFDFRNFV